MHSRKTYRFFLTLPINMTEDSYTTKLGAGQGLIEETKILLRLWEPGMNVETLNRIALNSGMFPTITARRLKNIVHEGFAPRYLITNNKPAIYLKIFVDIWKNRDFNQLLFLYTCRLHDILADYIKSIYWPSYAAGKNQISINDARLFVKRVNDEGKTSSSWSENMVVRVSSYLNGTCSDFSLFEENRSGIKKIIPFTIEDSITVYLAHDLHFSGLGDNSVLNHPDWTLFGMNRFDVLNELKQQALKGYFIIQSAGTATRIGWQYENMEAVVDALARE